MTDVRIDEEATRAARAALYGGQVMSGDLSDEALTAALKASVRGSVGDKDEIIIPLVRVPRIHVVTAPSSAPRLDASQLETALRSVPQICGHCRLLSDAPEQPCPSPRGHYFVTDYTAMADRLRAMLP